MVIFYSFHFFGVLVVWMTKFSHPFCAFSVQISLLEGLGCWELHMLHFPLVGFSATRVDAFVNYLTDEVVR